MVFKVHFGRCMSFYFPVVNKSVLSQTELPELARNLVLSTSALLQFKSIGVLRILVQGQSKYLHFMLIS